MKNIISSNPELKDLIDDHIKESNISYLSPYKKYGINMRSLQSQLIKH
ncbi:MAG: hypothetical protein U9Q66_03215 [Patescibacteria group bacterium]|nr:hypothetical protein [Patescibacteria group bacterium]